MVALCMLNGACSLYFYISSYRSLFSGARFILFYFISSSRFISFHFVPVYHFILFHFILFSRIVCSRGRLYAREAARFRRSLGSFYLADCVHRLTVLPVGYSAASAAINNSDERHLFQVVRPLRIFAALMKRLLAITKPASARQRVTLLRTQTLFSIGPPKPTCQITPTTTCNTLTSVYTNQQSLSDTRKSARRRNSPASGTRS